VRPLATSGRPRFRDVRRNAISLVHFAKTAIPNRSGQPCFREVLGDATCLVHFAETGLAVQVTSDGAAAERR
jgi:hypothetical protein